MSAPPVTIQLNEDGTIKSISHPTGIEVNIEHPPAPKPAVFRFVAQYARPADGRDHRIWEAVARLDGSQTGQRPATILLDLNGLEEHLLGLRKTSTLKVTLERETY